MSSIAAAGLGPQRIAIDGELTIYTAAEWKERLLGLFAGGDEIELDLCAVAEMDTAGLQLLIMAKQQAASAGKRLRLANHSQAVVDLFDLCGIAQFFGDPMLLQPRGA